MDQDLSQRLATLEAKVDKVWHSVEQTRKMYLWSLIIGAALFILPLIGIGLVIPQYLQSLNLDAFLGS